MKRFCKLIEDGDIQRCETCGAEFVAGEKIRAVCGVDRTSRKPPGGAGTALKKILARFGIQASPTCKCNSRAVAMDYHGVEWCEENIETIVGWLKEEAASRGLPFLKTLATLVVRRAIADAKATSASKTLSAKAQETLGNLVSN